MADIKVANVLQIVGAVCITVAAFLFYIPLGLFVLGATAVGTGVILEGAHGTAPTSPPA